MQMYKLILSVILGVILPVYGAAQPSSSSSTSGVSAAPERVIPLLQQKAFQALVSHPRVFARQLDVISYDPEKQSQLFVESVKRALVSRLGWRVLANPNWPLQQFTLSSGTFGGFSSDSRLIAISVWNPGNKYDTYVINAATGVVLRQIAGYFEGYSPDGNSIVVSTSNADGTGRDTHLINISTGATIWQTAAKFVGFSPDGSFGAALSGSNAAGAGYEVYVFNIATGVVVRQIVGHFKGFSPNGSLVAVSVRNAADTEYEICLINIITGSVIRQIAGDFAAFSPDEKLVAILVLNAAGMGDDTYLINITTGAVMRQIAGEFKRFSPDGSLVVVSVNTAGIGDEVHLINVTTGATIGRIAGYFGGFSGRSDGFSPDGSLGAVSSRNPAGAGYVTDVFNTATGATMWRIAGSFDAFSPDGNIIAIGGLNADRTGYETRLIDTKTGAVIWQIPGAFVGFSPDGIMVMTGRSQGKLILTSIDFSKDLMNITDPEQQKFLLNAAQDWLDKKVYRVDANNAVYKAVIERMPYLNDPLLFETLQDIYAGLRAELDEYAQRVPDASDPQFKDLALRTYDAWYDLQKSQDAQKKDRDIFAAFLETLKARHAWRVLRQHADALINNYQVDRAARAAQRVPQVPTSSSSHEVMAGPSSSSQAGTLEPVVGSSHDGVRAPDEPQTMRLFE